ncbi:FecR domain-containing protein [Achromobacter aloeverae]
MEQAAEWYAVLFAGAASDEDWVRWRAWLASDASHRQAWSYVEKVSRRLLDPLRSTPDPRLTVDNLHAANMRIVQRRRRILTCIAALVGTGAVGWISYRQTRLGILVADWMADHRTSTGEIRDVALSDGTRVWLNTASAFNVDFSSSLRRLHLIAGEILIETAADTLRPFVVDTEQGRLRALGTRFTVRQEEARTFVAVYQGAVEVRTSGNDSTVVIPAGQQSRFTKDAVEPLSPADPAREAWSRGNLIASDITLEDVVKELRGYTLGHIGVAPEVAQHRVFGTFPLRSVDDTLTMLAGVAHLRIHRVLPWWTTLEPASPIPKT